MEIKYLITFSTHILSFSLVIGASVFLTALAAFLAIFLQPRGSTSFLF